MLGPEERPRRVLSLLSRLVLVLGLLASNGAAAFEALDGRLQLHGSFETQFRMLNSDFSEQWDVAQWANVLNLELEADIAPDGIGPLDLVSAFMRVEARFDCIYSRGCGMFRGINSYGDRARDLPRRLSNAEKVTASGAILLSEFPPERISQEYGTDPVPLERVIGFDTLSETITGGDDWLGAPEDSEECLAQYGSFCSNLAGSSGLGGRDWIVDDPFPYIYASFQDFRYTQINTIGGTNSSLPTQILGPWLPENRVNPNALFADQENPFDSSQTNELIEAGRYNGEFLRLLDQELESDDPFGHLVGETPEEYLVRRSNAAAARTSYGGALPFRPIPIVDNGEAGVANAIARGVYIPTKTFRDYLAGDPLDEFAFNFSELERAFNRGASQQQTGELKELYFDVELFDSRLWLRLGKQTIVWGKTELFSATDQFNPQDLALSSLPSLEESRIALWAIRGVFSFYEVGPLQDVRLEVALNLDEFQGADLGACGEPYTIDQVCLLTFGALAHGWTGLGVVGLNEPPDPWEDVSGLEIGGRLEWRWDRFSFSLSDWWGYSDIFHPHTITTFDRNVDPATGRPRLINDYGPCRAYTDAERMQAAMDGVSLSDDGGCLQPGFTISNQGLADLSAELGFDASDEEVLRARLEDPATSPLEARQINLILAGYHDPNANRLDGTNALDQHHANQQLFAYVCSITPGIAAGFDGGACAASIFNSQQLFGGVLGIGQVASGLLAGYDPAAEGYLARVGVKPPAVHINIDPGDESNAGPAEECIDYNWGTRPTCGGNSGVFWLGSSGLSSRLTPQQEALLGCGPFWGTNCDVSGIDLLNSEGSVLLQSFIGFEGSEDTAGQNLQPGATAPALWTTVSETVIQPGTVGFRGGLVAEDVDPNSGRRRILPGSGGLDYNLRGLDFQTADATGFYRPTTDGCSVVNGRHPTTGELLRSADGTQFCEYADGDQTTDGMPIDPTAPPPESGTPGYIQYVNAARRTLYQPLLIQRGHEQIFSSEMAAVSFNFMMFVAGADDDYDEEFDAEWLCYRSEDPSCVPAAAEDIPGGTCSFATPQYCSTVQGILSLGGLNRPIRQAGGSTRYGRRDFLWHAGNEVDLRYQKRNVLGAAIDFAEDRSKMNFSIEGTWLNKVPLFDNNARDNITEVDELNITMSVDRPTFINFLNPNRTFFFNMQWFFQYRSKYGDAETDFQQPGPFNALFTFSAFTGYFQDRLLPSMTFVWDIQSSSGAFLPSFAYRYSERFTVQVGISMFFGSTSLTNMAINPLGGGGNRLGADAYQDGVESGLSFIRNRDELYFRLRYTF